MAWVRQTLLITAGALLLMAGCGKHETRTGWKTHGPAALHQDMVNIHADPIMLANELHFPWGSYAIATIRGKGGSQETEQFQAAQQDLDIYIANSRSHSAYDSNNMGTMYDLDVSQYPTFVVDGQGVIWANRVTKWNQPQFKSDAVPQVISLTKVIKHFNDKKDWKKYGQIQEGQVTLVSNDTQGRFSQ